MKRSIENPFIIAGHTHGISKKIMNQIYGKSQEKIDGRLLVEVVQEIMEENERSALKRLLDDEIVYHSDKVI